MAIATTQHYENNQPDLQAEKNNFSAKKNTAAEENNASEYSQFIYWVESDAFQNIKSKLKSSGYKLKSSKMTPCETLNAGGKTIFYATPQVWNRMCVRQGSWYRESDRAGKTLLVSQYLLPKFMATYLDAQMKESDFKPGNAIDNDALQALVDSPEYQAAKPVEWENTGIIDTVMFKIFFSVTRFWGFGDNLSRYWLSHRANHANFLAKKFTTRIDDEDVPYTVTDNKAVCSSCVEFFNVTSTDTRKLVNACPGAISFSKVQRNTYYDVRPINIPVIIE